MKRKKNGWFLLMLLVFTVTATLTAAAILHISAMAMVRSCCETMRWMSAHKHTKNAYNFSKKSMNNEMTLILAQND